MDISQRPRTKPVQDTALIVDSRRHEREAMEHFLSAADYHVLSANDREEAMELCRNYEGAIHLLVTDVDSAGASGWELAETAARMRPGLVVLFVSKESMGDGEARRALDARLTPRVLAEVTQALARKARQNTRCN